MAAATSAGYVLGENDSIFPGDPETIIERLDFFFQDEDGTNIFSYRIEDLPHATHTGTHLDTLAFQVNPLACHGK